MFQINQPPPSVALTTVIALTDAQEGRPHQVAREHRENDLPRPSGQPDKVDAARRHLCRFVCGRFADGRDASKRDRDDDDCSREDDDIGVNSDFFFFFFAIDSYRADDKPGRSYRAVFLKEPRRETEKPMGTRNPGSGRKKTLVPLSPRSRATTLGERTG